MCLTGSSAAEKYNLKFSLGKKSPSSYLTSHWVTLKTVYDKHKVRTDLIGSLLARM